MNMVLFISGCSAADDRLVCTTIAPKFEELMDDLKLERFIAELFLRIADLNMHVFIGVPCSGIHRAHSYLMHCVFVRRTSTCKLVLSALLFLRLRRHPQRH